MYTPTDLEHLASDEFEYFYNKGRGQSGRNIQGTLKCFCKQKAEEETDTDADEKFEMHDGEPSHAYTFYKTSSGSKVKTCSMYQEDASRAGMAQSLSGLIIVMINFVLKYQIASLVTDMRLVSKTEEKVYQMLGVTLMQFFNTAIIIFFLEFNWTSIRLSKDWYVKYSGVVYFAMIFTALWPLVEIIVNGGLVKLMRFYDRKWGKDKFVTSKVSPQLYIDLHAGPEFAI
jgi:hypothetical protein